MSDDGRRLFLSTLDEVCSQTGWQIHAYVLMSNHYHLLIETPEANLVAGMKWFQGAYTQRFNAMFNRKGHLYQGRYKAIPIATAPEDGGLRYFRDVSSYIHLNPFRAKLCGHGYGRPLQDHTWSSYPVYAGWTRKHPQWLPLDKVLSSWGLNVKESACLRKYREIVEGQMRFEKDPLNRLPDELDIQIRRGWYIGSQSFRERLDCFLTGRTQNDNYRGQQRREHGTAAAEQLIQKALAMLGWNESDIKSAKSVSIEKQAVAWLVKTHTTASLIWIAARLHMGHRTNCSRAISRFRHGKEKAVVDLKNKMLTCTG